MSGAFGLLTDGNPFHFPPDRLVEACPCVDVFVLAREGLLTAGASATLQIGSTGYPLAMRWGQIEIGDQRVAVTTHTHLPMPTFRCGCGRGAYRLYEVAGAWKCRRCHRLDYSCRHRHRSIVGLSLLQFSGHL
jgi:hypothetical protein